MYVLSEEFEMFASSLLCELCPGDDAVTESGSVLHFWAAWNGAMPRRVRSGVYTGSVCVTEGMESV